MNSRIKQENTVQRIAILLMAGISLLAAGGLLLYGPVPQDPSYHVFGDQRALFNIPNFWNVFSNLPFVLVGLTGLWRCKTAAPGGLEYRMNYILFFTGVLLTGFSSAWYHLQPDNWGLFWDRLSMALGFMAFLCIVLAHYISPGISRMLRVPLILFGLCSVVYWIVTEQFGAGDLRLYILTQFLPMLIIPVIIFSWKSELFRTSDILLISAGYVLAKVLESFDASIYQTVPLSGHTLKHLAASFSAYWMVVIMERHRGGTYRKEKQYLFTRRMS